MIDILFYHKSCSDGSAAAALYMSHVNKNGNERQPVYEAVQYNEYDTVCAFKEKFDVVDKHVIIVDFSFKWEVMQYLIDHAACVIWLDHHKTAMQRYCEIVGTTYVEKNRISHAFYRATGHRRAGHKYLELVLDEKKSGAALMHEWLYNNSWAEIKQDTVPRLPKLIQHVQDRDLWKFELEGTRELACALSYKPTELKGWVILIENEGLVDAMIEKGKLISEIYQAQVDSLVRKAQPITLMGHKGLIVNTGMHTSEVGHELAKQSGTFGASWVWVGEYVVISLRSVGDFDVSYIAKAYAGGGHKNAAGFSASLTFLEGLLEQAMA